MNEIRFADVERVPGGDVARVHVADIVSQINEMDVGDAVALLASLPLDRVVEIFDRPELARAGDLMLDLPEDFSGRILK